VVTALPEKLQNYKVYLFASLHSAVGLTINCNKCKKL